MSPLWPLGTPSPPASPCDEAFPSFWREMLQQKYPEARLELINSGISGDTTLDGLARLDWSVLSYEPDLVTINFGINDCVLGLGLEEFEMNLVRNGAAHPGRARFRDTAALLTALGDAALRQNGAGLLSGRRTSGEGDGCRVCGCLRSLDGARARRERLWAR